ncbi:hypothetical protein HDU93_003841 [Gonapodya sp. JEL0774]|nr:hypothetical protein HDU93_003841 [Gonapodya sp. JEL0774]
MLHNALYTHTTIIVIVMYALLSAALEACLSFYDSFSSFHIGSQCPSDAISRVVTTVFPPHSLLPISIILLTFTTRIKCSTLVLCLWIRSLLDMGLVEETITGTRLDDGVTCDETSYTDFDLLLRASELPLLEIVRKPARGRSELYKLKRKLSTLLREKRTLKFTIQRMKLRRMQKEGARILGRTCNQLGVTAVSSAVPALRASTSFSNTIKPFTTSDLQIGVQMDEHLQNTVRHCPKFQKERVLDRDPRQHNLSSNEMRPQLICTSSDGVSTNDLTIRPAKTKIGTTKPASNIAFWVDEKDVSVILDLFDNVVVGATRVAKWSDTNLDLVRAKDPLKSLRSQGESARDAQELESNASNGNSADDHCELRDGTSSFASVRMGSGTVVAPTVRYQPREPSTSSLATRSSVTHARTTQCMLDGPIWPSNHLKIELAAAEAHAPRPLGRHRALPFWLGNDTCEFLTFLGNVPSPFQTLARPGALDDGLAMGQKFADQNTDMHSPPATTSFVGSPLRGSDPPSLHVDPINIPEWVVPNLYNIHSGKNIAGPIPQNINTLTSLSVLSLANNHITGTVPDLTALKNLLILDLSNNLLNALPAASVAGLTNLEIIDANGNNLQGEFPDLHSLPNLVSLWLYQNNLTGSVDGKIPSSASDCAILDAGNNVNVTIKDFGNKGLFTCGGQIATSCFDDGIVIPTGSAQACQLANSAPAAADCAVVEAWFQQSALTVPWTVGKCCDAKLPNGGYIACDKTGSKIMELSLPSQNIAGPMPANLNTLTSLTVLSLPKNHITGTVVDLRALKNLAFLDLSNNLLTSFPASSVQGLNMIETLDINSNTIAGEFPDLHTLTNLASLWVFQNSFSGNVDGKVPTGALDCAILDSGNFVNVSITDFGNKGIFTCGGSLVTECFDDGIQLPMGSSSDCAKGPAPAVIGGGVAGALVGTGLIAGLGTFLYRRRRAARLNKFESDKEPGNPGPWMRLPDVMSRKGTETSEKSSRGVGFFKSRYSTSKQSKMSAMPDLVVEQDREVR